MVQFFVLETIFNSEKRPPKALGRDSLDPEVDGVHWLYVLSESILDKVRVPTGVYYNQTTTGVAAESSTVPKSDPFAQDPTSIKL